jgi:tetratricopeptide (TPR) repeat protein
MDKSAVIDESLYENIDDGYLHDVRVQADRLSNEEGKLTLSMILMRSRRETHRREAVHLLRSILQSRAYDNYIEASYCLALTLYSLNDFDAARQICEEVLRVDPDLAQAKDLHEAIVYKFTRQRHSEEMQQVGLITVGVGLAAGVGLLALLLGGGKRK